MSKITRKHEIISFSEELVVPTSKSEQFEASFQKLANKINKLDIAEAEPLTISQKQWIESHEFFIEVNGVQELVVASAFKYKFEGSGVILSSFSHELIAKIEFIENDFLVAKRILGTAEELESIIEHTPKNGECEHCKSKRARKHLYLIRNTETGEVIKVGKSCLSEYIGVNLTPAFLEAYYTSLSEFQSFSGYSIDEYEAFKVDSIIALSIEEINQNGFVKTGGAFTSTKQKVKDLYLKKGGAPEQLVEKHEKLIQDIKSYVSNAGTDSDYINNLRKVLGSTVASEKRLGLLVSAYQTFKNNKKREEEADIKAQLIKKLPAVINGYYPCYEAEKVEFTGYMINQKPIETQYGISFLITFLSKEGYVFKWFSSKDFNYEQGDKVKVKGTVKELSEYNGLKQVKITRCKVEFL